jgi:transposase
MDLTDAQWEMLQGVLTDPRREDGKGRPPREARAVLNGVLWILRTGAPWKDLPDRYPPYQTCHRRFQQWQKDGRFEVILQVLAEDLVKRGKLDLSEGAIDASFSGAKKGALRLVKQSAAKGPRSWQLQTAMVFLSPCTWPVLRRMRPDWWKPR